MTENNQRVNEQATREAFDKIAQADGLDIERGFKDGYRDADTRAAFRGFKLALQAIEQHASSAPAAPAVTDAARDVLTNEQIEAGAAVLSDDTFKPVGRNVAIMVYDVMRDAAGKKPAVTDAARDVLAEIDTILKGIDQQETQSENGWWETSAGAEFGMKKLREVRAAIEAHNTAGDVNA